MRMPRIYIAGPMGDPVKPENVTNALHIANEVMEIGGAPYVPHLSYFWHQATPKSVETWLALDFEWVKVADALYRIPGFSKGADREVEVAKAHGIPVFTELSQLQAWMERNRDRLPAEWDRRMSF